MDGNALAVTFLYACTKARPANVKPIEMMARSQATMTQGGVWWEIDLIMRTDEMTNGRTASAAISRGVPKKNAPPELV
jgi:hypothetical protein